MKGLDAILHYEGFTMAALGITVVFASLVVLALIVSQLYKVLFLWENRKLYYDKAGKLISGFKSRQPAPAGPESEGLRESARQFSLLVRIMGEPFSLPKLIRTAEITGISHAHCTVSRLIAVNLIVPDQKGFFRWNHKACERLLQKSSE